MELQLTQCKKVALAYSGGLDSALCLKLLFDRYGAEEVHAVTVNVGLQEEELAECRAKAELLNVPWYLLDCEQEFVDDWISKAVRANSNYEGYPVSTSMTRQLIAMYVAKWATAHGCDALCEGSTGKGNDQYRMSNVFTIFAPDCKIIQPVRDFNFTRDEEKKLCREYGIPYKEGIGDDRTMWCRSIGSGEVDNLQMIIPQEDYIWYRFPENAPDEKRRIEIEFEAGLPVRCDDQRGLGPIIHYLNRVAGQHGIGKIDMFEDGIMCLKSREVYEAPAAHVILKLHQDLEQMCLTKDEVLFKPILDREWARLTYHGAWFHPLKNDIDAFIERSQWAVNGKYVVDLYKGNIDIVSRESSSTLFSRELRSLATKGFDQRDSGPAVKIHGMQYAILSRRGLQ